MVSDDFEDVLRLAVGALSFVLFLIALLSYRRRPTPRVLILAIAFAVYAVKGIFLALEFFVEQEAALFDYLAILADVVFLVLVGLAVLRR